MEGSPASLQTAATAVSLVVPSTVTAAAASFPAARAGPRLGVCPPATSAPATFPLPRYRDAEAPRISSGISATSTPLLGARSSSSFLRVAEGTVGLIGRTTSALLQAPGSVELTFLCPICCENVRESQRVTFVGCVDAGHGCCRQCIGQWIRGLVVDGRVAAVVCPIGGRACGAEASPEEVLRLTDDEVHEKYQHFRRLREDPHLRQCPGCHILCKPHEEQAVIIAGMRCPRCDTEFCYYHSNAHVGRPCEDYRLEMAREERLAMEGAMRGTKPCPRCGIITEKSSGCNHMTCSGCSAEWCWVCGRHIEGSVGWHYNPANFSGCQQFQDTDAATGGALHRCLRCLMTPVVVLSVLIFVASGLTAVVWVPVAFLVGVLGSCIDQACNMAGILTLLPFVAWQVVWAVVALALTLLFVPCGARWTTLVFLAQVPFASVMSVLEAIH